ncbi:uncharacterized protein LOC114668167 [Erpetoichthys calabaricus]|uniref:uncharacterized protein LOC114668167 n=1 Tax=Erpetoichthys calabaricus TaxID=27687 RepID=UPI002234216F|nr:uncharacterized protein LOC114668167 [Erpetoichthys calabaricus]
MDDLQLLTDYKVNRCFKPTGFGTIKTAQMHHFADASEDGYGTVTYLVLTNEEGKKHCSFLMGKSRVAPLKQVTIPRLELTAAVVAVKMDKMLKGELQMPLEESTFWTDSTTVLKYISNESTQFKTFVANRISVIRDHSQPSQWRYVTSVLNPADQASRGLSIENFLKSTTWSQGPSFLLKPEKEWPKRPDQLNDSLIEDDPEVKSCTVNVTKIEEATEPINKLITYFSDWHRLKKAVAWFLKVELDDVVAIWNRHRMRANPSAILPCGKPFLLYTLPEMFGYQDELVFVDHLETEVCEEESIPKNEYPCDPDIHELCCILMEENGFSMPSDPFDAVTLYQALKTIIHNLL